ncbi:MAG TPA: organomercurial lyase [Gemmatimonadales bacterium]|nr:organomercurial lyase [Gemmatimonadales bacterium]
MRLSEFDTEVRLAIYRYFARTGDAPSVQHTSDEIGAPSRSVRASMERLAAAHVLVLDPATRELWMAMPFSAVPTAFRVHGEGRAWWANCAWDALGISAMLQLRVEIVSSCPDCGDPAPIRTSGDGVSDGSGVVHFAVPAASWWEDIGFT